MPLNVLITGAAGGLGRALARRFWQGGANLALVDRAALDECADSLDPLPGQEIELITADLSDADAPGAIIDRLRQSWEHLDALINNAAIAGPIGKCWENDWCEWQKTIQVDLLAPVALCRLCIPWMRPGAAIVNLAGGGSTGPRINFTAYATAKTGIVRFTEILALEVADLGIRANAIAPGVMNTAILAPIVDAGATQAGPEYQKVLEIQRAGGDPPENAAELAWFLATPESEGITGRLISAKWDPWRELPSRAAELHASDIYTLRRIVPEDRGKQWNR